MHCAGISLDSIRLDRNYIKKLNFQNESVLTSFSTRDRIQVPLRLLTQFFLIPNTPVTTRTMQYISLICLFLSALTIQLSIGNPTGAPTTACESMIPGHRPPPETGRSPFTFVPSATTVNRGQTITIQIRTQSIPFRGFIIQARNNHSRNRIVGQYVNPVPLVRLMNCPRGTGNSATHSNAVPKNTISLTWRAPADFAGNSVIFR